MDRAVEIGEGRPGLEAYEVRVEITEERTWMIKDGAFHGTSTNHVGGIGVRAFQGSGSGYAFCNEPDLARVREVVDRAADLARANDRSASSAPSPEPHGETDVRYRPDVDGHPHEVGTEAPLELLRAAEEGILEEAPEATTQVGFRSRRERGVLATSEGAWVDREILLSSLLVQCLAHGSDRTGEGNDWLGGERGVGDYGAEVEPREVGRRVGRWALEHLEAETVDPGRHRTLIDPRLTGIMVHESFGHLTEYDLVKSGWSLLADLRGERLADSMVTIRDAPTVEEAPASGVRIPYDHEGTPGETVTLLDEGVLSGYLHRRHSSPENDAPTGNARALNIHHPPIVRMRNTYMEPGDLTREEALEMVGDGLYLMGGRGGAPRSDGSFTFTAQHGYRVEDGEIAEPVRMATIRGDVFDFLQGVEGLTDDRRVDTTTFGGCGKWNQMNLPVGYGGPHAVIEDALVGGRSR